MSVIETERLRLRPLRDDDADFITREIGNYNVSKNLARVPHPYTRDDAIDFLDWIKSFDNRSLMRGLELRGHKPQLIGVISYEFEPDQNCAELGYWLAEEFWGQGLGTEAARAAVEHAFTSAHHTTLVSCFHNDNPASGRILTGLGFAEIGQCFKPSKAQGREVSSTLLRLTRDHWLAKIKKP